MTFPSGKGFAFSIVDDTDVATVQTIKPVYDALEECGLRTTKTVWMKRSAVPSRNYSRSQTMEDREYAEYIVSLHRKGFEIAFHGASMESSERPMVVEALEAFRSTFGHYPRIHVNHSNNQDNLYWGPERFSSRLLRTAVRSRFNRAGDGQEFFQGHRPGSPFFWGDLCREHICYVRNFCFDTINQARVNPSQPYHDRRCEFVNYWFSGLDAPDVTSFNGLLSLANLDRLEREGGVCIVATHFGKSFVENDVLNADTRRIFEDLARRPGWYVTVATLLDHLRSRREWTSISRWELMRLQLRWLAYRVRARGVSPL